MLLVVDEIDVDVLTDVEMEEVEVDWLVVVEVDELVELVDIVKD